MAKADNVAALVDYQSSSAATRKIIELNIGTVTLFAFDKGQRSSNHTAPFDALVHVIDGEVEITIDGHNINMKSGKVTIILANRRHSLKADSKFKMMDNPY